ncbi:MAG: N-acetylmuramoyl-L-alanine amidase [Gammaproteobacteria bacterium]|nr:MAG: N-acetylmuramoyl-L-alanine amidase [Gammaproteobacteria bacterium]RKZ67645.1 MAG: N-acetylmuramoyl-L-alanine amidase [Gammaproteobacteria bacterium]
MRKLYLILCFMLPISAFAGQVTMQNVRIWAAPDNTRVVFDVSGRVEHKLELLSNPDRLVVDIKNAKMPQAIGQPVRADRYLNKVRSAERNKSDLRVVFDLKKNIEMRSFLLQPNRQYGHRLVIDLYDENKQDIATPLITQADNNRSKDVIIAVDAGHGGDDPGATGPHGVREKDVTLQIARNLVHLINQEYGMKAVLIREGDYFLSLRNRIGKAREHKADLFISIHADAFRDPRVKGSSVYILSNRGASSEAAKWLAERENAADLVGGVSLDDKDDVLASVLLDLSQTASLEASIGVADRVLYDLKKLGKTHKKYVQSAGFAVLKSPDIPSILVETAYISNPEEEKNLKNAAYQTKLAKALLSGLKGYFTDYAPEGTLLAAAATRKYVIVRGDTLSGIAQRYSVSMNTLRDSNRLKNDRIRVGQVLNIPTI